MLYYSSKILQVLGYPATLGCIVLGISYILVYQGKKKLSLAFLWAGFLFFYFISIPFGSSLLVSSVESKFAPLKPEDYPTADMIVLLGGSMTRKYPPQIFPEEVQGPRLIQAVRLFRAKRAPQILVSGGFPYPMPDGSERSESVDMTDLLVEMGIPRGAIVQENLSRTTYENATEAARLLLPHKKKILLVTSALHLPRAQRMFECRGFESIPVPSSFIATRHPVQFEDFVPFVRALSHSSQAFKELLGKLAYTWIDPCPSQKR